MAHGKTLELNQIYPPPVLIVCKCGEPYDSHLTKKGTIAKKFGTDAHAPMAFSSNRQRRRAHGMRRNVKKPALYRKSRSEHAACFQEPVQHTRGVMRKIERIAKAIFQGKLNSVEGQHEMQG